MGEGDLGRLAYILLARYSHDKLARIHITGKDGLSFESIDHHLYRLVFRLFFDLHCLYMAVTLLVVGY